MGNLKANSLSSLNDAADVCIGPQHASRLPDICPNCSRPATKTIKIRAEQFSQSSTGEMLLFGWLGYLFRLAGAGFSSEAKLEVKICNHCWSRVTFFKILDWFCRLSGIAAVFVLVHFLSTPEKPLIDRGIGLILLATLVPILLGLSLGYAFRRLANRSQGLIFRRSDDQGDWFQVRSGKWLSHFSDIISNATKKVCQGQAITQSESAVSGDQDKRTAFLIRTYHARMEGRYAHLQGGAEEKKTAELAGLNRTVADIEKEYSKMITAAFRKRPFDEDEWLAGAWNKEFLLTNKCLYLFLDHKIRGRIEILLLENMAQYLPTKGNWLKGKKIQVITKDGREQTYGPFGAWALEEYVNALKEDLKTSS
ncbi:MAG: hypothetical protein JW715_13105 [Sedimentisphaerales bacterium]|nr:hypothetical protein [Sedimentisphaerales bacterium]